MIVLFGGIGPLLLTEIIRNEDGTLKSGTVCNGAWRFEIRDGEYLCKQGNHIVTRYNIADCGPMEEILVPNNVGRNPYREYNRIIAWAEDQRKSKG